MKAAWYERQGPAHTVLVVDGMPTPEAGPGEVRIRMVASGINPGEVKKRQDTFGVGMPYPRVVPHSDGAGIIDQVGAGIPQARTGERVWCFGAQSYRPFGTAAEYCVVPSSQAVHLPDAVSFEQGACLGIPGITGHRAVFADGPVAGKVVLIQGGAGAVGQAAVALACQGGATVIATVRSEAQEAVARVAGAEVTVRADGKPEDRVADGILNAAPDGVHHIVEVAFHANVRLDERVLRQHGSMAAYATGDGEPRIPFWPLVFKNIRLHFLGSDDFLPEQKSEAALALNGALEGAWTGFEISQVVPLLDIAKAHQMVEDRVAPGRVVLRIQPA